MQKGRILAGKFRLDRLLATGAMGEVWRARHLGLDKDVAVKILRTDRSPDDSTTDRFIQEARTASRLEHTNSVSVLDFGRDPSGPLYLAMELLEGNNLCEVLQQRGHLPLDEVCPLMSQILAGLAAAHSAHVLHRDIKPSNIMLLDRVDDDGQAYQLVKVCDFGLAKFTHQTESFRGKEQLIVGTPLYMSPEQAVGEQVDERSDVYACGVVFFEMLTGRPPFEAERAVTVLMKHCASPVPNPSNIISHLPAEVDAIAQKTMAKDPAQRFQTAREFRSAVIELMRLSSRTRPPPPEVRPTSYFLRPPTQFTRVTEPESSPTTTLQPQVSTCTLLFEPPIESNHLHHSHQEQPSPPLQTSNPQRVSSRIRSSDAHFLWERYALSPHRSPPTQGFWLQDAKHHRVGPLTFDELALALRLEALEGTYGKNHVATDPQPHVWRPASTFLRTVDALGVSRISPPRPTRQEASGRINSTTIPTLFALATRTRMNGRLICISHNSAKTVFFEIHLWDGQPTLVDTNELSLQTPSVLIERNVIHEHDLPYLVHDAWQAGNHLNTIADSMKRLADMDLNSHYGGVMRSRLRKMLQLTEGTWIVDKGYSPEKLRPFSNNLLALLPRIARESVPATTVQTTLKPYMNQALITHPGTLSSLEELGFTSNEWTIAKEILASSDLASALPLQTDLRNTYATIAYLLISTASIYGQQI
ncbi:MAG: serine/threonine protein kinase [Myxococcales bacterium]|nr:serine/threonine protein kinase [Myxococcales bacterium]